VLLAFVELEELEEVGELEVLEEVPFTELLTVPGRTTKLLCFPIILRPNSKAKIMPAKANKANKARRAEEHLFLYGGWVLFLGKFD
jgi:hypothetical protein